MADVIYGDPVLPERYWDKVYPCPITGCWIWGGASKRAGYGIIYLDGGVRSAHRAMFKVANGYLPEYVCHQCDFPPCVNSEHLFAGDAVTNNEDARRKGRNALGERCGAASLTEAQAIEIILLKNTNVTQRDVADKYAIEQSSISMIWGGDTWRHLQSDPVIAAKVAEPCRQARPPECKRGHLFTPENTRVRSNGTRNCRACARDDARHRAVRKRQLNG